MTATKQQQLEWLAKNCESWPSLEPVMIMDDKLIGVYYYSPIPGCHFVSRAEWQQERDKMHKQGEKTDSWHERGELPPVGCECWYIQDCKPVFIVAKHCAIDAVIFSSTPGGGELYYGYRCDFRPLLTRRDEAIDEMKSLVMDGLMSHEMAMEFVIKLHDAGYRKVKP